MKYMLHAQRDDSEAEVAGDGLYFGSSIEQIEKWATLDGWTTTDFQGVYEISLVKGKDSLPDTINT